MLTELKGRVEGLCVFDIDPQGPAGTTILTWGGREPIESESWLAAARQAVSSLPEGGLLAGFIGYEAGGLCERMPTPADGALLPCTHLRATEGHVRYHHPTGKWTLAGTDRFQREARQALAACMQTATPTRPSAGEPQPLDGPSEAYMDAVRQALHHIHEGNIYQVNLAWEARLPPLAKPFETWLRLRADNPARRSAFVALDDRRCVASNSPELYLEVVRSSDGLMVRSTPIKGTADRSGGPLARRHLHQSEKEIAELTMIVDLVRNDLGKVAEWGQVRWDERRLSDCGDLIHAEQTVSAPLRAGLDALDAVQATFPPGSVTGAPKVRAMELIRSLEPAPRGVYTGGIGFFSADGTAHLNVAIRTFTCTDLQTSFHVGAGIVADSHPEAEWHETRAKGRRIHAALNIGLRESDK